MVHAASRHFTIHSLAQFDNATKFDTNRIIMNILFQLRTERYAKRRPNDNYQSSTQLSTILCAPYCEVRCVALVASRPLRIPPHGVGFHLGT